MAASKYSERGRIPAPENEHYPTGKRKYSTLFELASVAFLTITLPEGRICDANMAASRMLGYSREELAKMALTEILAPELSEKTIEDYRRQVEERGNFLVETVWVTRSGERLNISASGKPVESNGGTHIQLVARDITESKQMEKALQRSEMRSQAILDVIPDLMFLISSEGTFLDFHTTDPNLLIMDPEEFIGQNVEDVLPAGLAEMTMEHISKALTTEEIQIYEYSIQVRGKERFFESRLVVSGEGEVLSIIRDITERTREKQALHKREAILSALSQASELFLMSSNWEEHIQDVLSQLGKATQVSRMYIFQNHFALDGDLLCSQRYEWTAPGIQPMAGAPVVTEVSFLDNGRKSSMETLSKGEIFFGNVRDFPESERQHLEAQAIVSILQVPIFVSERWWGFIGLDDCESERSWSVAEIESLKTAASIIGAAIQDTQAEQMRAATLKISEAAHSAQNLEEMFGYIHQIISELMPTSNFYIAIYDEANEMLSFPYFIDEMEESAPPTKPGKGLTEYVLRTGQALLASPEVFDALVEAGEVESVGPPSIDWLGVPLKTNEKTIGVLTVQSYHEGIRFNKRDLEILKFVSTQAAMAIERKRSEEALRESKELYQKLVDNLPVGIYRNTPGSEGIFLMANPAFLTTFGYASEEELRKSAVSDLYWNPAERMAFSKRLIEEGSISDFELRLKRKDGTPIWGSVTARVVYGPGGEIAYFDCAMVDVSQRVQHQHEREALLAFAGSLRVAQSRSDVISTIFKNLLNFAQVDQMALVLLEPAEDELLIERASGGWAGLQGSYVPANDMLSHKTMSSGLVYLDQNSRSGHGLRTQATFGGARALACIPLMTHGRGIGLLWMGRERDIQQEEINLLSGLADIAANAINRVTLHEQTQRRVQRLSALRTVDMAISSSLDLRVILNVLLDQLAVQLNVDAAIVLQFNRPLGLLEHAASRGFRMGSIHQLRLRLSDHLIGRSAFDRRTMFINDLGSSSVEVLRQRGLAGEGFKFFAAVPLVAKGQMVGVLELYNHSEFTPDLEWKEFLEMMAQQAAIAIDNASLFNELQRSNIELALAYDTTLEGWVRALNLRSPETEEHTRRITGMAARLARLSGVAENQMIHLSRGALLHDIGEMAIPDGILQKPGPLEADEWEIMRCHPQYAYELLSPILYLRPALDIPYCHHERWDGAGYPRGLKGLEIPLAARIFSVVDVWDALRSDRPYRKAWTDEQALQYIQEQAGAHFDPEVVEKFFYCLR